MKNRKGYMLIEIVLASAIAFGIAFFVISLIIKLKNKNDDALVMTQVSTDQAIITNKLMAYAVNEQVDFDCEAIAIDNNKITYKGELIDIVNDYANITTNSCTNSNGAIKITFPVEIPQLKDKDYNIDVEYKYLIGDLSHPQLAVITSNGTTYSKSKTATIKLTDNEGMASGTYKVKYGWSTGYIGCDKMTSVLTFNVGNNEKEVSQQVTISGQSGAGMLYACTSNAVNDLYNNELPANVVVNDNMYLDNTGPVVELGAYNAGTISSGTTVVIKITDGLSGVVYNSFTKDDLEVYIGSTRTINISLDHTGSGNYNLTVNNTNQDSGKLKIMVANNGISDNAGNGNPAKELNPNINFDSCATTVDKPSCTGYSGCSVSYRQQTGTKTRTCTHKYYSSVEPNYLCSTGTSYTDSTSCTGSTDACSSTYDSPSCGGYGSCSVTWAVETGTMYRTCTHRYYSNYIGGYLCSTGSQYTDSAPCNGSRYGNWVYTNWGNWSCGFDCCKDGCKNLCAKENDNYRTNVWSCTDDGSKFTGTPYGKTGRGYLCWCYTDRGGGGGDGYWCPWCSSCFVGGTKVLTPDGLKNIEKMNPGDYIYSYNEETKTVEIDQVAENYQRVTNEDIYTIYTENTSVSVTPTHPFYVKDKGWVQVKDLKEKDILINNLGTEMPIKKIKINDNQFSTTVYNLKTEKNHTYFAGLESVLVHNKGGCFPAGTKVMTIDGYKDIDKIVAGDIVLTYNEVTKRNEYNKVTNLFKHNPEDINDKLYTLSFDDNTTLEVTSAHRFYIKRNNKVSWIAAEDLKVNDKVLYANGKYHKITAISDTELTSPVYNITVENNHNYYVGDNGILVHNVKAPGA